MSESTELQRAVEALTASIEQLRSDLVRKDVYQSNERARDIEMRGLVDDLREIKDTIAKDRRDIRAELQKDRDERATEKKQAEQQRRLDRRALLTAFVLPALLLVLQIYLAAQLGGPS